MRDRTSSSFAFATCSLRDDPSWVNASISSLAACSSPRSFSSSAFAVPSWLFVVSAAPWASATRAESSASRWASRCSSSFGLLGDLFLQLGFALGEPVLQLGLALRELGLQRGLPLDELGLQLGLALDGRLAQLPDGRRGFPGQRLFALRQLALRAGFDLLELRLELLARRADTGLKLGLAFDQVGAVRRLEAFDLGARGT